MIKYNCYILYYLLIGRIICLKKGQTNLEVQREIGKKIRTEKIKKKKEDSKEERRKNKGGENKKKEKEKMK